MANRSTEKTGCFGVIAQPQSYLNLLYLLLGLPLGTLYFTVLVTGFSLGISLMLLALLGIPILIGLWYVVHAFMQLERAMAVGMVGASIEPVAPLPAWPGGLWTHFKNFMGHTPTWKGIGFLLLRFPAGIATFTIAVTLVSVSLAMTFAPVYMWTSDNLTWGSITFDPFWWSFLLVPIGVVLVFVSLHIMDALATVCAQWAGWSVGGHQLDEAPATTIHHHAAAA
ncbi:MAG: sensor domain-containing protein [Acidimicrobiia bacterium]|nr:sensor domain-containing protein [Acidimicrobiia bacterium]